MNYNLLTEIDKELIRLNPEYASPRQLKHLAWARSTIQSAKPDPARAKPSFLISLLFTLKEFIHTIGKPEPRALPVPFNHRPKLPSVKTSKQGSFLPPRYFSKGSLGQEKTAPIPYLLIETNEISEARPVPGNSAFLRSIAKGKGVLQKNNQGLFYLDISDRFISSLIPYLKANGLVRAPYFNLFQAPNGAHIPVIPPREAAFHFIDHLEEIGKEFTFEIEGLYSIEPTLWPEVEQVWFFKVRSPELEVFRQKQLLLAKPGSHSFHIAVAIKPRPSKMLQPLPHPMMRINVAYLAA